MKLDHQLQPGAQLVPYPYRIEAPLSDSSRRTTEVYRATVAGQELGWPTALAATTYQVVVKVANRPDAKGNFATGALEQEAQLLRGLHHPHIVRLLPVKARADGSFSFIEQSQQTGYPWFIVLEYLPHGSLASLMAAVPQLPLWIIVEIGYTLAATVGYLHRRRLVHMDLKPRNLLFRQPYQLTPTANGSPRAGEIVLIDFGSATLEGRSHTTQRVTFQPSVYLPPEWIQAAQQGEVIAQPALDIYALGVILYQLLAGQPPFVAQDIYALERAILNDIPPPPTQARMATVNATGKATDKAVARQLARLDQIVLATLHKDPRLRFSADQLADALQEVRIALPSPRFYQHYRPAKARQKEDGNLGPSAPTSWKILILLSLVCTGIGLLAGYWLR